MCSYQIPTAVLQLHAGQWHHLAGRLSKVCALRQWGQVLDDGYDGGRIALGSELGCDVRATGN